MNTAEKREYGRVYTRGYLAGQKAAYRKMGKQPHFIPELGYVPPSQTLLGKIVSYFRAGLSI